MTRSLIFLCHVIPIVLTSTCITHDQFSVYEILSVILIVSGVHRGQESCVYSALYLSLVMSAYQILFYAYTRKSSLSVIISLRQHEELRGFHNAFCVLLLYFRTSNILCILFFLYKFILCALYCITIVIVIIFHLTRLFWLFNNVLFMDYFFYFLQNVLIQFFKRLVFGFDDILLSMDDLLFIKSLNII